MAFVSGKDGYFALDDRLGTLTDLSDYINQVDATLSATNHDTTVFGRGYVNRVAGLEDGGFELSGLFDAAVDRVLPHILGSVVDFVYCPEGNTSGKVKYSGTVLVASYSTPVGVDSLGEWSASLPAASEITRGTVTP